MLTDSQGCMRPLPLLFLQRGSEQAGSALSSVGGSGISDAIAYATEELGRALAAARSASALGVAGALPGAAAAAESLSLARGALQVRKAGGWGATRDSHPPVSLPHAPAQALSHRLGSLAGVGSATPAVQGGGPQAAGADASLQASWGASGALLALHEAGESSQVPSAR